MDMSRKLNLDVVAEGVESEAQVRILSKWAAIIFKVLILALPLKLNRQ